MLGLEAIMKEKSQETFIDLTQNIQKLTTEE